MCAVVLTLLLAAPAQASRASDPLGDARRLYNSGDYDEAERISRAALELPATANAARVIFGRIQLERYRQSASPAHLTEARTALRDVDPRTLDPRERIELTIGLGEALFLEDRFAAAADVFEPVLGDSRSLGEAPHERVLDWWATALDRYAQARPQAERADIYERIGRRMAVELERNAGSSAAGYWMVAAIRGRGELDAAWTSAMGAWVRAALAPDRGAALRADLDRLMLQAIIPERAARISPRDSTSPIAGLTGEWEAFKTAWTR